MVHLTRGECVHQGEPYTHFRIVGHSVRAKHCLYITEPFTKNMASLQGLNNLWEVLIRHMRQYKHLKQIRRYNNIMKAPRATCIFSKTFGITMTYLEVLTKFVVLCIRRELCNLCHAEAACIAPYF